MGFACQGVSAGSAFAFPENLSERPGFWRSCEALAALFKRAYRALALRLLRSSRALLALLLRAWRDALTESAWTGIDMFFRSACRGVSALCPRGPQRWPGLAPWHCVRRSAAGTANGFGAARN